MNSFPVHKLDTKDFPPLIKEIADPPETLYYRGDISSLMAGSTSKLLTVVGSRKATSYGRDVLEFLIGGLKGYDITIISGLALGIDGYAHKAAIDANLHTVAIPGSGLNDSVLYPQTHVPLARQILESDGALLSEFEPKERAAPWTFPKRNRIMAGMAHAVLIIEATQRSGTLITARLAVDYNRELLVVPGSIFADSSKGSHQFLKLGATPVTEPKDILEALSLKETSKEENDSHEKKMLELSKEEWEIYGILGNPTSRDELIKQLSFSVTKANILLSKLELDGVIIEKLGTLRRA